MLGRLFGKVVWVGRTAATVLGLAFVLALVFGVATTAIGATGGTFILGKANTAGTPSSLAATIAKPTLTLINKSTDAAATALNISVDAGNPPLRVNAAAGTATNLSADELDGDDSSAYQRRVSGACDAGSSIQTIGADGAVACEQDNDSGEARVDQLKGDLGTNDGAPNQASDPVSFSKVKDVPQSVMDRDANTLDTLNSTDFQRSNAAAGGDLSGNYPNPQLANGAVRGGPGGKIEDESITSADINEHGVTSMDILNDTIESGDIATGGVGSAEVANGGLDVADVAEFQYNFTVDPPPINGQSCYTGSETLSTVDSGDLVIVNAADDLPPGLVMFPLTPSSSNPQFKYRICNITSSAIDPASGGAWRLAIFDDGNDN